MSMLQIFVRRFFKQILISFLFTAAMFLIAWAIYTAEEPKVEYGLGFNSDETSQTQPNMKIATWDTANAEYVAALKAIDINNPRSCIPCHATIYEEWRNSYHRYAHEDQLYRTNIFYNYVTGVPGIPWCENCHISESTLEVDPLKQPVSRRDAKSDLRLGDGIDCASCHRKGDQIVGKHGTAHGCKTVGNSYFGTPKYCGGCHSSFLPNTLHEYEEWLQNPKPVSVKKTCVQCHMKDIAGKSIDGAAIKFFKNQKFDAKTHEMVNKTHKQHNFYAGHDAIMLKSAIDVEVGFEKINEESYVVVRVTNKGTGHKFPTGTAKRRVNIFVSVEDADGNFVGGGDIDMRKPKPEQDIPDTQVEDGGWREFDFYYDVPKTPGGKARVIIRYKHHEGATNDESIVLHDQFYPLPQK